jgi:signal transduction histidine kinase
MTRSHHLGSAWPFGIRLVTAFAAVVGAFLAATYYAESRGQDAEGAALEIATVSAPLIERLTAARASLSHVRFAETEYVRGAAASPAAVTTAERAFRGEVAAISRWASSPAVAGAWRNLEQRTAEMDRALGVLLAGALVAEADARFRALAEQVAAGVAQMIEQSAAEARRLALRIEDVSSRRRQLNLGLAFLCGVATIVAALFLARAVQAHDRLLRVHQSFLERRSSEHEAFAGRVAHDLRGSLAALSLTLQYIGRMSREERVVGMAERGGKNVEGVIRLMDGLLAFARAGARAEAGARADVDQVVAEVAASLRAEATSAETELVVDAGAHAAVGCSAGVLSSLLANLIGNAVKHMGSRPVRRVTVRSRERAGSVRVEVEDTGPGIEPEMRAAIFEPYVRGKSNGTPGIGLGLATVKRLAEGHGGRVGVEAVATGGSVFWFELPCADDETGERGTLAAASPH